MERFVNGLGNSSMMVTYDSGVDKPKVVILIPVLIPIPIVIPSEARNLSLKKRRHERRDPSQVLRFAQDKLRMTTWVCSDG